MPAFYRCDHCNVEIESASQITVPGHFGIPREFYLCPICFEYLWDWLHVYSPKKDK